MTNHENDGIDFEISPSDSPPTRPRRRILAGVGAAMLVAAAGGVGFGIGRSIDDDRDAVGPLDATIGASDEDLAGAPAETDDTPADERDDTPAAEAEEEPAEDAAEEPADGPFGQVTATVVEGDAPSFPASGGAGWAAYGDGETTLLTERVTDDGLVLRAHLGPVWEEEWGEPGFDGWQPPGWCFESGQVRVALGGGESAGNEIIDVGSVSWWSEPFQGRAISWVTLGRVDGNPHRVVVVQVPDGTTSVTVEFGDGASDTAVPENGVAVLAVAGAPTTVVHDEGDYTWLEETPDFSVTFAGGDEPLTVDDAHLGTWSDPEFQASCSPPPPELPDPGEQPADAAAAEAEIVELMSRIYGDDAFDTADGIDDPTGVAEARDAVAAGGFEEAAASAEAVVEELVFTTPTDAWFRYRIDTSMGSFRDRFGQAVLVDGAWKVTRATICQDLAMAGGSCEPWVDAIQPPAAG